MFRVKLKACAKLCIWVVPAVFLSGFQPASAQSTPYIGQMLYVGFNFAPVGWATCDGQIMAISDNTTLFNLIGTTYGGDGQTTFALPDMRGRIPIHQGNGFFLAQRSGSENATLVTANMPVHTHSVSLSGPIGASSAIATSAAPGSHAPANTARNLNYATSAPNVTLGSTATVTGSGATGVTGGSQPFSTVPPFLTVNCIISLFGVFPSQN